MEDQNLIEKIHKVLDSDFKEYLGEYGIELIRETTEYSKKNGMSVIINSPKIFGEDYLGIPINIEPYALKSEYIQPENVLKTVWRAVAEHWLKDESADKGEKRLTKVTYYDGSTRGIQNKNLPLPSELGEKEEDIRWRLAFGKELQ